MDEENDNIQFQLKYFPKYYSKVIYEASQLRDGRVAQKIRRSKVIRSLHIVDYSLKSRSKVLNTFQAQRRHSVETNIHDASFLMFFINSSKTALETQSIHSWRLFVNSFLFDHLSVGFFRSLINEASNNNLPTARKFSNWRFWSHAKKLSHLKHLRLHLCDESKAKVSNFLDILDRSSLLQGLETLDVAVGRIDWKEPEVFYMPNVLAHATNFQVYEASSNALQQTISNFSLFRNLTSLNISKIDKYSEDDNLLIDFTGLKALKNLHKLQTIDITLNLSSPGSLNSFLDNFSIPTCVSFVKLTLYEVMWNAIVLSFPNVDWKTNNAFVQSHTCRKFFEQWQNLTNLSHLSLSFMGSEAESIPSLYFTIQLLSRISRLEMFYYSDCGNVKVKRKKAFDFGYFWNETSHLRRSIKKIYIESHCIALRDLQDYSEEITPLEELGLCGLVLGDTHVWKLQSLLRKNTMERSERSHLEVERLVVDNEETFGCLLESLTTMSRKIKTSLKIDVRRLDSKVLADGLCKLVKNMPTNKFLDITFSSMRSLSSESTQSLLESLKTRRIFGKLALLDQTGVEMFSYDQLDMVEMLHEKMLNDVNYNMYQDLVADMDDGSENDDEDDDGFDYASSLMEDEIDHFDDL